MRRLDPTYSSIVHRDASSKCRRYRCSIGGRPISTAIVCLYTTLPIALGCDDGPQVGDVNGVVSYHGEPMKGLEVSFDPVVDGRRSTAITDSSGSYELNYTRSRKGALVGQHQVRLMWPVQKDADLRHKRRYPIPPSYNTETTLTFEVQSGKNTFDVNIDAD